MRLTASSREAGPYEGSYDNQASTGAIRGSASARILRALSWAGIDLRHQHATPKATRVLIATVASLLGSLAADAALVAVGTRAFPSTKGYVHFQISDYAKLTIIGVVIACAGWPMVTRISSARAGSSLVWPSW